MSKKVITGILALFIVIIGGLLIWGGGDNAQNTAGTETEYGTGGPEEGGFDPLPEAGAQERSPYDDMEAKG
jgi:hypothetical protein